MKFIAGLLIAASCHAGQVASWYVPRVNGMVCASYEYPMGTRLKVTEVHNGSWVIVTVIERGPNRRLGRTVDLSRTAFLCLDGLELGLAEITIERIK